VSVTSQETEPTDRRVLVIAHTGRREAQDVAREFCLGLTKNGLSLRLLEQEATELALDLPEIEVVEPHPGAAADCEVVVVIGGDGTILRAAELARECGTPLLGINLGHVGFLAEAESDDVAFTIDAIVNRRYTSEERLTLDVSVYRDAAEGGKELVCSTWTASRSTSEPSATASW
jgi:NAD+ kinase